MAHKFISKREFLKMIEHVDMDAGIQFCLGEDVQTFQVFNPVEVAFDEQAEEESDGGILIRLEKA